MTPEFCHKIENAIATAVRVLLLLACATPLVAGYMITVHPFTVGKSIYAWTLILLALVLWTVLITHAPQYRPRRSWILAALLAFLAISCIAALLGVDTSRSIWSDHARMTGVFDLAHWCAFAVMVSSMFRSREQWRTLLTVLTWVAIAVAVIGLYTYFASSDGLAMPELRFRRLHSTIGHPFPMAVYLCLSAGLSVVLMMLHRTWWQAALTGAMLLLSAAVIWYSGTRGPFAVLTLLAVAVPIAILLIDRRHGVRRIAITALAGVILLVGVGVSYAAFAPTTGDHSIMVHRTTGTDNASFAQRREAIGLALHAARERPVWGWGPENFIFAYGRYVPSDWPGTEYFDNSHNKYLEVLFTTGIMGALAFGALVLLMMWVALRDLLTSAGDARLLALAVGSVLAAYLVLANILVDHAVISLCLFTLVGYLAVQETDQRGPLLPRLAFRPRLRSMLPAVVVMSAGVALLWWNFHATMFVAAQTSQGETMNDLIAHEQKLAERFPDWYTTRVLSMIDVIEQQLPYLEARHLGSFVPELTPMVEEARKRSPHDWRVVEQATLLYQTFAFLDPSYASISESYYTDLLDMTPTAWWMKPIGDAQDEVRRQAGPR